MMAAPGREIKILLSRVIIVFYSEPSFHFFSQGWFALDFAPGIYKISRAQDKVTP